MANYADISVGEKDDVPVEGGTARLTRPEQSTFTVQRHFDGSWNTVVWVREDGSGWRVSRQEGSVGEFFDDLAAALEVALRRSGEALN